VEATRSSARPNWLSQAVDDLGHALDALGDEYNALVSA
jgi:hypothetical protein